MSRRLPPRRQCPPLRRPSGRKLTVRLIRLVAGQLRRLTRGRLGARRNWGGVMRCRAAGGTYRPAERSSFAPTVNIFSAVSAPLVGLALCDPDSACGGMGAPMRRPLPCCGRVVECPRLVVGGEVGLPFVGEGAGEQVDGGWGGGCPGGEL